MRLGNCAGSRFRIASGLSEYVRVEPLALAFAFTVTVTDSDGGAGPARTPATSATARATGPTATTGAAGDAPAVSERPRR